MQGYRVFPTDTFSCPACLDDPIGEACLEFRCVRTVFSVYLDTTADRDKAKHIVSIDWVATLCQLEFDTLQVLVDDQYIILEMLHVLGRQEAVFLCTSDGVVLYRFGLLLLQVDKTVAYRVRIKLVVGNVLIELSSRLITHLFDQSHHRGLIKLNLPVLETSFDGFLGKGNLMSLHLFQCLFNLGACF